MRALPRPRARATPRWPTLGILLLACVCATACTAPQVETGQAFQRSPHAAKVILIGIDGADWDVIEPMIAGGDLPTLARLRREGVWGRLRSAEPLLSPLLWTTIASGKTPDEHGILSFVVSDAATGEQVPVTSDRRRVKALWNMLGSPEGGAGRVGFVGWLASWPAEEVSGFIVTDRLGYHSFAYEEGTTLPAADVTHPPGLLDEIRSLHHEPGDVSYEDVAAFIDVPRAEFDAAVAARYERDQPIQNLRLLLATAATYRAIGLDTYRRHRPDLFGIFFELIDSAGHLYMHYAPPQRADVSDEELTRFGGAMAAVYRHQDAILADLVALADERTAVIVVSDHGFKSGDRRPKRAPHMTGTAAKTWHELYGIFVAWGYGIAPPARITHARIADVTPTVLALLGAPVAEDFAGRVLTEALDPGFLAKVPVQRIASYGPRDVHVAQGGPHRSGVDGRVLDRLEALGYVSGEGTDGTLAARLRMEALVHLEQRNFEEAVQLLSRAVELEPDNVAGHADLGAALMELGRLAEARTILERALTLHPDLPEAHNTLGQLLHRQGDLQGAVAAFERALVIEPNDARFRTNLGDAYRALGDLDRAARELARAVALAPQSARARNNYATVLILQRKLDEAQTELEAVVARDPRYALAYHNLGYVELARGRPARAEPPLRRALELSYEPSRPLLVKSLRAQGRDVEAERVAATVEPPALPR